MLGDEDARAAYARRTAPPEEVARAAARQIENDVRARERRARLARNNPMVSRVARIRELIDRGRKAMEEERFADAARDFLTATALDPAPPRPARSPSRPGRRPPPARRATSGRRPGPPRLQHDLDRAQFLAEAAAEAEPGEPRYVVYVARLALERGALDTARQRAEAAVRSAPSLATAHEVLGEVLAIQGDSAGARRRWSARWSWTRA